MTSRPSLWIAHAADDIAGSDATVRIVQGGARDQYTGTGDLRPALPDATRTLRPAARRMPPLLCSRLFRRSMGPARHVARRGVIAWDTPL